MVFRKNLSLSDACQGPQCCGKQPDVSYAGIGVVEGWSGLIQVPRLLMPQVLQDPYGLTLHKKHDGTSAGALVVLVVIHMVENSRHDPKLVPSWPLAGLLWTASMYSVKTRTI